MSPHLPVLGISDVAAVLGVSKQRADQLSRQREFPEHVGYINGGKVWDRKAIEKYDRDRKKRT